MPSLRLITAHLLPPLALIGVVLFSVLPLHVPVSLPLPGWPQSGISLHLPLGLMLVYFWAVYRPDLLGVAAVFLAGLLFDVLAGSSEIPPGLIAISWVVIRWIALELRRFLASEPFALLWGGMAMASVLNALIVWGGHSLLMGRLLPPTPALGEVMLAIALFPPLAFVLIRLNRRLPE
ncbi:MAG: hypothetical protein Alpg2KO_23040 [Alphaproteobacteria bacterium]